MTRRCFLKAVGGAAVALGAGKDLAAANPDKPRQPNFIIIFTDDQGYNDLGCFGSAKIRTPRIDRMAAQGVRLTSFYAHQLCGPSRAAIMTGCYPMRLAEPGNVKNYHTILHTKEITIAEVLKGAHYATMAIGKWHLAGSGSQAIGKAPPHKVLHPGLMPTARGFDAYFGIPYSNDMKPSVLLRGNDVVESPVVQDTLTARYTDEAVKFIRENRDKPFFLYLAHNMPHTPLHPGEKFSGKCPCGLYGDCVEEIDAGTGRILDELGALGLDENTLVIFTSDNGPWIEKSHNRKGPRYQGGLAEPLRGAKMMTWDGGPRVPCVIRWPGRIDGGRTIDELATTMDFMPTLAKLAGAKPPSDRVIDGKDIMGLLTGKTATSPHEAYFFYKATQIQAVRSGQWKLVLPRPAKPSWLGWYARLQDEVKELSLYDLTADISETRNFAATNPKIVKKLLALIEAARADIGDCDRIGKNARFYDADPKRPDIAKYKQWLSSASS